MTAVEPPTPDDRTIPLPFWEQPGREWAAVEIEPEAPLWLIAREAGGDSDAALYSDGVYVLPDVQQSALDAAVAKWRTDPAAIEAHRPPPPPEVLPVWGEALKAEVEKLKGDVEKLKKP